MATSKSNKLDALQAKATAVVSKANHREVKDSFYTPRSTFQRRSRFTSSYTKGRSYSSDSNDSTQSKARSRSRSLSAARHRPLETTDPRGENELVSNMRDLTLHKSASNSDHTPSLLESMQPMLPPVVNERLSHERHTPPQPDPRKSKSPVDVAGGDPNASRDPFTPSPPPGFQDETYPVLPSGLDEQYGLGTNPDSALEFGNDDPLTNQPIDDDPVDDTQLYLHAPQTHTVARNKPLTPVVEFDADADEREDDEFIQGLDRSGVGIDELIAGYEQRAHRDHTRIQRLEHVNREHEEDIMKYEKKNEELEGLQKEVKLLHRKLAKSRDMQDYLTLENRDKKELEKQNEALTRDISVLNEDLKRLQENSSSALREAKQKIRGLEKELANSNTQLGSQQQLINRLKGRIDRFRSSAARVANRNPLIERSTSSLSLASDQDEMLVMDQRSDTHLHTHTEKEGSGATGAPDRHQLNDMKKTMSQLQWPKRATFPSFDQYLGAVNNTISTIRAQGVLPDIIALFLNNHLMASPIAAEYSVNVARHGGDTIEGILEALKGCDTSYFLSKEEQFSRLMIGSAESAIGYMKRLETAFSELMTHDPINITAKNRKAQTTVFHWVREARFP